MPPQIEYAHLNFAQFAQGPVQAQPVPYFGTPQDVLGPAELGFGWEQLDQVEMSQSQSSTTSGGSVEFEPWSGTLNQLRLSPQSTESTRSSDLSRSSFSDADEIPVAFPVVDSNRRHTRGRRASDFVDEEMVCDSSFSQPLEQGGRGMKRPGAVLEIQLPEDAILHVVDELGRQQHLKEEHAREAEIAKRGQSAVDLRWWKYKMPRGRGAYRYRIEAHSVNGATRYISKWFVVKARPKTNRAPTPKSTPTRSKLARLQPGTPIGEAISLAISGGHPKAQHWGANLQRGGVETLEHLHDLDRPAFAALLKEYKGVPLLQAALRKLRSASPDEEPREWEGNARELDEGSNFRS